MDIDDEDFAASITEVDPNISDDDLKFFFMHLLDPLPPLTNALPEKVTEKNGFMIRPCYSAYFDEILQQVSQKIKLFVITGSPGIGKSFFTCTLLCD
jgi:hypothetical protein